MKSGDIVQEAYDAANICIRAEFKDSPDVTAILSGPARSIDDVQRLVEEAQTRYHDSSKDSKVLKWLRRASSRITYYGQVLDVLAQHHPEYLALAWGTMKFILIVREGFWFPEKAMDTCSTLVYVHTKKHAWDACNDSHSLFPLMFGRT